VSVFKRGTAGFYYYDYVLDGVRHAGSTRKRTKREAAVFEYEHQKDVREGLTLPPGPARLTLGKSVSRLYEERWSRTRTGAQVKSRLEVVCSILGQGILLSEITGEQLGVLIAKLRDTGMAEATLNRYKAHVKTLLTVAQREWGAIPSVPFIKLAKESQGRLRFFTPAEETAILDLLRAGLPQRAQRIIGWNPYPEAADLFTVLADTGMRLMEAVELCPRDVNMETNMIHIWKNKADTPRSVPMTERVCAILAHRLSGERVFLFTTQAQVSRVWAYVRRELPWAADAMPHTFRHTTASRLVQNGVDLYTVQRMLGHSTIRVTERYAHLAPKNLQVAADALNALQHTDSAGNNSPNTVGTVRNSTILFPEERIEIPVSV
jgi:integrase